MNRCNLPVDFEAYQQTKMKGIPVTRYAAERGVDAIIKVDTEG